jgi:hypothetical protein
MEPLAFLMQERAREKIQMTESRARISTVVVDRLLAA